MSSNKIAIVNTLRYGDILQTLPLIYNLKHNDFEIDYFIDERFSNIKEIITGVNFIPLPLVKWTDYFSISPHFALEKVKKEIKYYTQNEYSYVINLSHSRSSAILLSFFKGKKKGFVINERGIFIIKNKWLRYLFVGALCRLLNPFNLVDTYLKIFNFNGYEFLKNQHLLGEKEFYLPKKKYIGFQLGASKEHKRWKSHYFGKLASLLSKKDYNILLLGTENEKELLPEFYQGFEGDREKIINLMGKTSLSELVNVLKKITLLITNDTGTMHIAAFLNKKIITIDSGPIFYTETAPYTENAYIVAPSLSCYPCEFYEECINPKCRESITPEMMFKISLSAIHNEEIHSNSLYVYKCYFDEKLEILNYKKMGSAFSYDEYIDFYRIFWLNLLNNKKYSYNIIPDKIREFKELLEIALTSKNQYYMEMVLEELSHPLLKPLFWYIKFEKERLFFYNGKVEISEEIFIRNIMNKIYRAMQNE